MSNKALNFWYKNTYIFHQMFTDLLSGEKGFQEKKVYAGIRNFE